MAWAVAVSWHHGGYSVVNCLSKHHACVQAGCSNLRSMLAHLTFYTCSTLMQSTALPNPAHIKRALLRISRASVRVWHQYCMLLLKLATSSQTKSGETVDCHQFGPGYVGTR
jgi:hypothetical protein